MEITMLEKVSLYLNTVRYMKPSQVYYRIKKKAKAEIKLKTSVASKYEEISPIGTLRELDFDEVFLHRFPIQELINHRITFLHQSEKFDWNGKWRKEGRSALWNFNLHYFEFLHSMTKAYLDTKKEEYLCESKRAVIGWIKNNPVEEGGDGWASYTIALRLTNWLSYWSNLQDILEQDKDFSARMINSIYEQYVFLSKHLEKDLLGNHYFEDLKALLLCSIFFKDSNYEYSVLRELKKECEEQILGDGMHFELSPMYHNIIFEGLLRVAWALRVSGRPDCELEKYIKPMADVTFSFGRAARTPLFNDGGNNVSKSVSALLDAALNRFQVHPEGKKELTESGYYFFQEGKWQLIIDAGQPGPAYIPGHSHCDAMSFELFRDGKPVLVNCGTYAYQCKEREYFRSTRAHNTVMINGTEQSQCWGAFRLAKRSHTQVLSVSRHSITMEMIDQKGQSTERKIEIKNGKLRILDKSPNAKLTSFLHFEKELCEKLKKSAVIIKNGNIRWDVQQYSPEFGIIKGVSALEVSGNGQIDLEIELEELYASVI